MQSTKTLAVQTETRMRKTESAYLKNEFRARDMLNGHNKQAGKRETLTVLASLRILYPTIEIHTRNE